MKYAIITSAFLFGAALNAQASTEPSSGIRNPPGGNAEINVQVRRDGGICDREAGAEDGSASANNST